MDSENDNESSNTNTVLDLDALRNNSRVQLIGESLYNQQLETRDVFSTQPSNQQDEYSNSTTLYEEEEEQKMDHQPSQTDFF